MGCARGLAGGAMVDAGMAMAVADAANLNTCDEYQWEPTNGLFIRGRPPRGTEANWSPVFAMALAAGGATTDIEPSSVCSPALTSGRPRRPARA